MRISGSSELLKASMIWRLYSASVLYFAIVASQNFRTRSFDSLSTYVARVNRLFEEEGKEKQFGFILDYEGLLGELDRALTTYSAFEGFDQDDPVGALHDIREEIRKLPQLRNQLWDLFKTIRNKKDMEQFEQLLADEAKRQDFYTRLRAFGRCLHIALSSEKLYEVFNEDKIEFL